MLVDGKLGQRKRGECHEFLVNLLGRYPAKVWMLIYHYPRLTPFLPNNKLNWRSFQRKGTSWRKIGPPPDPQGHNRCPQTTTGESNLLHKYINLISTSLAFATWSFKLYRFFLLTIPQKRRQRIAIFASNDWRKIICTHEN